MYSTPPVQPSLVQALTLWPNLGPGRNGSLLPVAYSAHVHVHVNAHAHVHFHVPARSSTMLVTATLSLNAAPVRETARDRVHRSCEEWWRRRRVVSLN